MRKNENKMLRARVLSIILSLMMCLSMMPTLVFAEGTDEDGTQVPAVTETQPAAEDAGEPETGAADDESTDPSENADNAGDDGQDDGSGSGGENNQSEDPASNEGNSGDGSNEGSGDPNQDPETNEDEKTVTATETEEVTVTRTIHYVYDSKEGAKAAEDNVRTLNLTRTKTTYSDDTEEVSEWKQVGKGATAVFNKVPSPSVDGAKPDRAEVPEALVKGDNPQNIEEWVIYTKDPKEITISIMGGVNRHAPIVGVEYELYRDDGSGDWTKVPLTTSDQYFKANVIFEPSKGTKFKLVEAKKPTWLHSPLTDKDSHVFTLKENENGEVVATAEDGYEYHEKPTDNIADFTIYNTSLSDYPIDSVDAMAYEWHASTNTANFFVLYGTYYKESRARDYTLKLTVKKEVVNGADPDREYEFTIMPLFGYAIDSKARYNISVPGEMKSDDGRLSDAKVISVWLDQPDGDKLVDEDWLAEYLKYIFQLTVPAHSGEYWKEKTFESIFSQIEKMNLVDSGLAFLIADDADTSVETLEKVIEVINKNTNYFFEWEGEHFLASWKKLNESLNAKDYDSFEAWLQDYDKQYDTAYKELISNEDLTEEEAFELISEMTSAWVKAMQDAGFTRNDMRFLRVFSQDGLISITETKTEGTRHYQLEAMTQEQREEFIKAHSDILTDELMSYLIGNTFKLKDGESKTLTIPNKVALDEFGGLLIMEKRSDDYVSSGSISTYFLVAPEDITYDDPDNDTWEVTQVITNTFEKTEEEEETTPVVKPTVKVKRSFVNVTYVNEEKKEIASPEKIEDEVGAAYETEVKEIEGYKLKEVVGEATGTISEEPKEVEYIYAVKGTYEETDDTKNDTENVNNGKSTGSSKTPATGDSNDMMALAGLMALCTAALGVLAVRRRRED